MTKRIWTTVAGLIAVTAVFSLTLGGIAVATPETGETTELDCTVCHDKPGSKLLTDEGKYYEVMGSLDGFDGVVSVFGECTSCHVKKPGSLKLTQNGRRFKRLVGDMEGVKEFIGEEHPFPPGDGEEVCCEDVEEPDS